ncbi:MAG: hypothetical protein J1F36_00950 [Clostridiales bacterium]|nr:hypothetical protein [Clostridiales bacterium]
MKTKMLIITCVSFLVAAVMYYFYTIPWCFTLAIVASTTFYHFAMRLVVGGIVDGTIKKDIDYNNFWFRQKKWESKVYSALHVHGWKDKFPTYAPDNFDLSKGLKSVIQATCVAEIVHEIIIPLGFLPLIVAFIMRADVSDIVVFAVTGAASGLVDLFFVIIQRYNRPRLIKALTFLKKSKQKTFN